MRVFGSFVKLDATPRLEEPAARIVATASNSAKMDMSSMEGMGMDMSSDPMFRTYNQILARGYWYIFAFVAGILLLLRAIEYHQNWSRYTPKNHPNGLNATRADFSFT